MKTQLSLSTQTNERAQVRQISLFWPLLLLVTTGAATATVLSEKPGFIREILAMWFMLVVPGMSYIHLMRLHDWMVELALAVGLSLAIDIMLSLVMVYTQLWLPLLGFGLLVLISLPGIMMQFWQALRRG